MKAIQCDYFVLDIEYLENDNKTISTKIVYGLVWCQDGRLVGSRQKDFPNEKSAWVFDDILTGDVVGISEMTTYSEDFVKNVIETIEASEKDYPEKTAKFKQIIEDAYEKRPDMWAVIEEVAEVE